LWAAPYWPGQIWWLADLFQMAPLWVLYYPLGFLFIMALAARGEKGLIIVHILSFAIIMFCIMGFNVPFSAPRQKNVKTQNNLRIMTCNLGTNVDISLLSSFITRTQPDIIAFQEAYADNQSALETILSQDKWNFSFQEYLGLASQLKIKNVDIKNRNILGGWGGLVAKYELEGPMGSINFFNMHLDTPRLGIEAIMDNGLGGLSEIKRVTELREKESGIVLQWIMLNKMVLAAGDFNMPEANPIYRKYWSSFTNAFSKTGFGFGYTKYTRWHGIRIDHLLCDGDWRVVHAEAGPDIGSDHRPVVADVEFIGIKSNQTQAEEPKEQITAALKIERDAVSDSASGSVKFELWNIEAYPIVSFSYMVLDGIPLEVRVKTIYNDWINLKDAHLINDGKWHEIHIDVRTVIKGVLPAVKYITEFQFYIPQKGYQKDSFWINDFKMRRD